MHRACDFVDIHCHMLPGIDDGAKSWDEALAMAEIAVADGIREVIVTPHQLGGFEHNLGAQIRQLTAQFQESLDQRELPLTVLPGADVRIDDTMIDRLGSGEVLSLGDRRRHVLLELPHELYFPLDTVLDDLSRLGMVGILSHPERNQGLLQARSKIAELVDQGCLMQVTAGSLMGTFGTHARQMSEWMLNEGMIHFLATDAHGPRARRPLLRRAFERVAGLRDRETAFNLCCRHPSRVAAGEDVELETRGQRRKSGWLPWRKAG